MLRTTTEKAAPKPDPSEIARKNHEATMRDRETLDQGLRLGAYFAEASFKRTRRPGPRSTASTPRTSGCGSDSAKKECRTHIYAELAAHEPAGRAAGHPEGLSRSGAA